MEYRKYKSRYKLENFSIKKQVLEQLVLPELFSQSSMKIFSKCINHEVSEVSTFGNCNGYTLHYKSKDGTVSYDNVWVDDNLDTSIVRDLYNKNKIIVPMKVNTVFVKYARGQYLGDGNGK